MKVSGHFRAMASQLSDFILSVPVRIKIIGIMIIPVLILGLSLNYWVQTGLSDWLSWLLSDQRVEVAMQAGGRSVLFVTILAAAASIILTFLLTYILTQPLIELRQTSVAVSRGDLGSRARVWSEDEIGEVARSVNKMIDHLVTAQEDLRQTNRRLEVMNRVAMAANQESEIHDTLYRVLDIILDALNMDAGWIYLYDPEKARFHLGTWRGVPDRLKDRFLHTQGDELCACQRDLLQGSLPATSVMRECERIDPDAEASPSCEHISVKLEANDQAYGIMNLLCSQQSAPSPEVMDLLTAVGMQLSDVVANAWLNLKLTEKERNRQELLIALNQAQESERARLARELHDGAGQALTSLLLQLKGLQNRSKDPLMGQSLGRMCENVSETIEYIRRLSYQLRPVIIEEFGLETALNDLIDEMSSSAGLNVDFSFGMGDSALPEELNTTLFRICQECLTNIARHAHAKYVTVVLGGDDNHIHIAIEDDGQGFDVEALQHARGRRRLGLASVRERVESLGGSLDVFSAKDEGTRIEATIPMPTGVQDE